MENTAQVVMTVRHADQTGSQAGMLAKTHIRGCEQDETPSQNRSTSSTGPREAVQVEPETTTLETAPTASALFVTQFRPPQIRRSPDTEMPLDSGRNFRSE